MINTLHKWPLFLQNITWSWVSNQKSIFREDVQRLFAEKDRDHDGFLSFEEFTGQETKIEMAFKAMDKDGDGHVSKEEFKRVCKGLTSEQVAAAFNKFDKEGTGKLNYREFCTMMHSRQQSKKPKTSTTAAEQT